MPASFSRRDWLTGAALAAGATLLPAPAPALAPRRRVLRCAHITDIHVQPGLAEHGFAQALHHLQSLPDKPDLILNTGDAVMDSFGHDEASTQRQWTVWQTLLKQENSLPVESCLGNHDCWGGARHASRTTGDEPRWGKRWACDVHGLAQPYRSFDRAGWHWVVLDSTFLVADSYLAKLDDAQFEWLAADLQAVPKATPVIVLTHQPVLSASAFFSDGKVLDQPAAWQVPGGTMHLDAQRLKDLFYRCGNVKLCLSGHLHLLDRVDYLGTSHVCDGAVSGNWWNAQHPARQELEPGYGIVDLYSDGTFEHSYHIYGWRPQA